MIARAFLYATGIVYLAMLLVPRWSRLSVLAAIVVLAALLWPIRTQLLGERGTFRPGALWAGIPVLVFALHAGAAAPWHWDFWAIWGLKGRVFFEHRGIDWTFLGSGWNAFAHPDYPVLLPLNYAFLATMFGEWNDRWLGLFFVPFVAALAAIAYRQAIREVKPFSAAAIAFAMAWLAASQYVGLAEIPLIVFGTAGLLHVRNQEWTAGAVLLGLAASTKNEGLTLLIAAVIAAAILYRRNVLRLWPAAVVVAPWLVLRAMHGLKGDLTTGNVPQRVLSRDYLELAKLLMTYLDKPLLWCVVALAMLIAARSERFLVIVVAIQAVFFIGAYAVTPHDVAWHVSTSWDRLSRQLLVPASYAALLSCARQFASTFSESASTPARR